jgi:hypothetical protein
MEVDMKTALLVFLLMVTIGEEANSGPTTVACPSVYDPVCGIKHGVKKNYNNSCLAENAGAVEIARGFCERSHLRHKH